MELPIYAVGDIHGRYDELCGLMKNIEPHLAVNAAKVVFLGDYSGYGKYSLRVMKYLHQLRSQYPQQVILLAGNWEDMLAGALFHGNSGFEDVLRSRGAMPFVMWLRDHPQQLDFVRGFLENLSLAHAEDEYVFAHAGVSAEAFCAQSGDEAISKSKIEDLLWQWNFFEDNKERTDATLKYIVGHVPIQVLSERILGKKNPPPRPMFSDNIIVADFGASRSKGFLGYVLINPDGTRKFKTVSVIPVSKKQGSK